MSKLHFVFKSIKQFRLFRNTFYKIKYRNIYNLDIDDEKYLIILGKIRLHYKMNLKNPQTFNEKINWYKLHYCSDLMKRVVDKIEAKKYIYEKGLSNILVNTITVFDNIEDIRLDELPEKFVMKNTMDSGGIFICKNKSSIKIEDIYSKLRTVINFKNGKHINREYAYTGNNNRIIVESLIETENENPPYDYKFFCFNGKPCFFIICRDRDKDLKIDFYDTDCNLLNVRRRNHKKSRKEITNKEDIINMLNICEILSKDFPFVRVDLYCEKHKIFFSELTFYPGAGFEGFKPKKWDRIFGDMWDLSIIDKYR